MKSKWVIVIMTAVLCISGCKSHQSLALNVTTDVPKTDSTKHAEIFYEGITDINASTKAHLTVLLQCPSSSLPYVIDLDSIRIPRHIIRDEKDIAATYLINHPIPGRINSPLVRSYEYMTRLDLSRHFFTFVLRTISVIYEKQIETTYYIANVDSNGDILAKQPIAAYIDPEHIETAIIYSTDSITSAVYSLKWKQGPMSYGYASDTLIEKKKTEEINYHIDLQGNTTRKLGKVIQEIH